MFAGEVDDQVGLAVAVHVAFQGGDIGGVVVAEHKLPAMAGELVDQVEGLVARLLGVGVDGVQVDGVGIGQVDDGVGLGSGRVADVEEEGVRPVAAVQDVGAPAAGKPARRT